MYHCTASKIENPHFKEYAIRVPGPMRQGSVNKDAKKHHKQNVRCKTNTFCGCSYHERRRNYCEFHLEQCKQENWNGRSKAPGFMAVQSFQHKKFRRVSYKTINAGAKCQSKSKYHPQYADQT